jgi:hypothetical protein
VTAELAREPRPGTSGRVWCAEWRNGALALLALGGLIVQLALLDLGFALLRRWMDRA